MKSRTQPKKCPGRAGCVGQIRSSGCLNIGVDDTENQSTCTVCSARISVLKAVDYPEEFDSATTIRLSDFFRRGNPKKAQNRLRLDGTGRRRRPALLRQRALRVGHLLAE